MLVTFQEPSPRHAFEMPSALQVVLEGRQLPLAQGKALMQEHGLTDLYVLPPTPAFGKVGHRARCVQPAEQPVQPVVHAWELALTATKPCPCPDTNPRNWPT